MVVTVVVVVIENVVVAAGVAVVVVVIVVAVLVVIIFVISNMLTVTKLYKSIRQTTDEKCSCLSMTSVSESMKEHGDDDNDGIE